MLRYPGWHTNMEAVVGPPSEMIARLTQGFLYIIEL